MIPDNSQIRIPISSIWIIGCVSVIANTFNAEIAKATASPPRISQMMRGIFTRKQYVLQVKKFSVPNEKTFESSQITKPKHTVDTFPHSGA